MERLIQGRDKRLEQISNIEKDLGATLLVYFCADAPIIFGKIAEDAPRPIYDHLRMLKHKERLALYLYSIGGVMEAPWKIITMLREFCDELFVVVPYKAYSAATMIAIGADRIWMTDKAELGPIDPALEIPAPLERDRPPLPDLGVEDIAAYLAFMRERAKLTDQQALAGVIGTLAEYLTPPLLGRLERVYSHIRLVARNLLSLHKPPLKNRRISAIVEALTEKMYVHGHGIGRKEAAQIGLDVANADGELGEAIWTLYEVYEEVLRLAETRDVEAYFAADSDSYEKDDVPVACIESRDRLDAFIGKIMARRRRQIPPQPTINISLPVNIPPNVQPGQLPQAIQQAIQQVLQNAAQQLEGLIAQELARQSPIIGVEARLVGGVWRRLC